MHIFSYNSAKATENLRKHGVSFGEAEEVFVDPLAGTKPDPDATDEDRFIAIGRSSSGDLLVVVFTEREGQVRLISARRATPKERRDYER